MDVDTLERLALVPYLATSLDPLDPPPVFTLIREYMRIAVERPARMLVPARRFRFQGRERIAVRAGLPVEYAQFYAAHELAHFVMNQHGHAHGERDADYLGAALLAPRLAVLAVHAREGLAPRPLAEHVTCTQFTAIVRLGEVLGRPVAAVAPTRVLVRGEGWPDDAQVRALARGRAPGLAKVRLTDQPGRVALVRR